MGQVSAVLRRVAGGYVHWCPGCEEPHVIYVSEPHRVRWQFDGNLERPTFAPSVRHRWGRYADPLFVEEEPGESGQCHYFIRAGRIEFVGDSTHKLAGQTVPLSPLPPHLRDGGSQ